MIRLIAVPAAFGTTALLVVLVAAALVSLILLGAFGLVPSHSDEE